MPQERVGQTPQLLASLDNSERLKYRAMAPSSSSIKNGRPTGRGRNTLDGAELISRLLEETSNRMDTDQDSLTVERVALEPALEGSRNRTEVSDMMENALNQLTNRLDARVTQVMKKYLTGIIENFDDDHNMAVLR